MTEDTEKHIVRLPDELVAKVKDWAASVVAYYRSNGTVREAMPWTRDQLTDAECGEWLASREEAGRQIDVETCEIGKWAHTMSDPYGLRTDMTEDRYEYTDKSYFVRSPESDGWVHEGDLPVEKSSAMYDRIHREWQAYCRANPDDPRVRAEEGSKK